MATLQERFDAVCMSLGLSNKEATIKAIEEFVERTEFLNKVMEGCGEEHLCTICNTKFNCYYFCGQSMGFECKLCSMKRVEEKQSKKWWFER